MCGIAKGIGIRTPSSNGYFEKNEHDLLDCSWPENQVLKLLIPLVGGSRDQIRERGEDEFGVPSFAD
jgi:hypothetical protein